MTFTVLLVMGLVPTQNVIVMDTPLFRQSGYASVHNGITEQDCNDIAGRLETYERPLTPDWNVIVSAKCVPDAVAAAIIGSGD